MSAAPETPFELPAHIEIQEPSSSPDSQRTEAADTSEGTEQTEGEERYSPPDASEPAEHAPLGRRQRRPPSHMQSYVVGSKQRDFRGGDAHAAAAGAAVGRGPSSSDPGNAYMPEGDDAPRVLMKQGNPKLSWAGGALDSEEQPWGGGDAGDDPAPDAEAAEAAEGAEAESGEDAPCAGGGRRKGVSVHMMRVWSGSVARRWKGAFAFSANSSVPADDTSRPFNPFGVSTGVAETLAPTWATPHARASACAAGGVVLSGFGHGAARPRPGSSAQPRRAGTSAGTFSSAGSGRHRPSSGGFIARRSPASRHSGAAWSGS